MMESHIVASLFFFFAGLFMVLITDNPFLNASGYLIIVVSVFFFVASVATVKSTKFY